MRGLAPTPQFEYTKPKAGVSLELKLQRWYRKAAEYNIANDLVADLNSNSATKCNFVLLTLTTVAAVFLAFGEPFPLVAAVLTAAVTALGGIVRSQDFGLKALQHASATMQWAEVERELLTLLHACTAEQQAERFKEAAKRYDEANKRQPLMPPLRGFRRKGGSKGRGGPLFEFITESAVHKVRVRVRARFRFRVRVRGRARVWDRASVSLSLRLSLSPSLSLAPTLGPNPSPGASPGPDPAPAPNPRQEKLANIMAMRKMVSHTRIRSSLGLG